MISVSVGVMRVISLGAAAFLLVRAVAGVRATPLDSKQHPLVQQSDVGTPVELPRGPAAGRKLHGRFLHLTGTFPGLLAPRFRHFSPMGGTCTHPFFRNRLPSRSFLQVARLD